MASNSKQRIMEKSRNCQIVYVGRTHLCKHCTTDHVRGIMKLGISQPPLSPIAVLSFPLEVVTISSAWRVPGSSEFMYKQSPCGRHGLSNILKLQAMFLYSIYHQRAGKTNLFHMRGGVDFMLLILDVPLKREKVFLSAHKVVLVTVKQREQSWYKRWQA